MFHPRILTPITITKDTKEYPPLPETTIDEEDWYWTSKLLDEEESDAD